MAEQEGGDDANLLRQYLGSRDVPCPHCQYNLRNLTNDVCPECGEQITLRLQALDPRQAAAIAGLVALSAGAGLNGLLLIYWAAVMIFYDRNYGGWWKFLAINAIGFVVLGALLALWLIKWKQIRRLAKNQRWLLVGACAFATLADLVCFIKFIR